MKAKKNYGNKDIRKSGNEEWNIFIKMEGQNRF